jgi:hypothetical protein
MSGLKEKTCEILRKPLASFTRRGQGGNFSYHKGSDVIRRLNEAFGHSWSSEKLEAEVIEDQVLMLVSLSVYVEGDVISHQGYGSADIARGRNDGKVINIGNTYKSAFTNALKKAAEQYGIGLEDEEGANASSSAPTTPYSKPTQSYTQPAAQRFSAPAPATTRPTMARPEAMTSRSAMSPRPSGAGLKAAAAGKMSIDTPPIAPSVPVPPPPATPPVNPTPMVKPEVKNDLVSSVQEHALQRLASMKNLTEAELVMGALPASGKVSFKELLRSEASEVIKYANVQPQGNA